MTTTKFKWSKDMDGEWLSFQTNQALEFLKTIEDGKTYEITIKEFKNKRSLNANAYAFSLISKLASANGLTVEEVYKKYMREIGGNTDVICIQDRAVDTFRKHWASQGLGWQTDILDSKIKGCTNVVVYYGSSTFDRKEMSVFIDHIVQDCEAIGIPTMTNKQILEMLGEIKC